jgi:hypothetical protein
MITDPRKRRGKRHSSAALLAMSACAMLSGAKSFLAIADWAAKLTPAEMKKFRNRRATRPSEPTFRRLLKSINAQEFDDAINRWFANQAIVINLKKCGKTVPLGGSLEIGVFEGFLKAENRKPLKQASR